MRTRHLVGFGALAAGMAVAGALHHCNVFAAWAAPAAPHAHLFGAHFEDGEWDGWQQSGDGEFAFDDSVARSGARSVRLTIRRDGAAPSARAEIVPVAVRGHYRGSYARFHEEYWYGFSLRLPADWVGDGAPESLAQWHDVPDRLLLEGDRNPPLALVLRGERVWIEARWDASLVTPADACWRPGGYDGEWVVDAGGAADLAGRWCDWVLCVRWAWCGEGAGRVRAWRDGALLVDRTGPNCFRDLRGGPYLKLGLYKWPWQQARSGLAAAAGGVAERTVWIDDVWIRRGD